MPVATGLPGLPGLARRLRMAVHKVSVTAQVNLRDRLRELNADRYDALTASAGGHLCSDLTQAMPKSRIVTPLARIRFDCDRLAWHRTVQHPPVGARPAKDGRLDAPGRRRRCSP